MYKKFGVNKAFDQEVGRRLKEYRKNVGVTKPEMAAYLGIARAQYSRYEHGTEKITMHALVRFAEAFSIAPDELTYILTEGLWTDTSVDN